MTREELEALERAAFRRPAWLHLTGYHGKTRHPCFVVSETPTRYRIESDERLRLPGRDRWLEVGKTALVPKQAVTFREVSHAS